MSDDIFQIATAAIDHRARRRHASGVLLTDFASADSSVDHRWVYLVLERANVLRFRQNVLICVHVENLTPVEHVLQTHGNFNIPVKSNKVVWLVRS